MCLHPLIDGLAVMGLLLSTMQKILLFEALMRISANVSS